MRIVINILLVLIILALGYFLVESINDPIRFKAERDKRENAVIDKLKEIREAQEMYRDITGKFAGDFDTLARVLKTGEFMIISVIGDPDDPNYQGEIIYDTTYEPAIKTVREMGMSLDSLRYVPYGDGATFNIYADTITYQQTLTPVVQVGVVRAKFMGPYASAKYSKYDQRYDPQSTIKFGSMTSPNTSGNWE
jgi:hypothetical protein